MCFSSSSNFPFNADSFQSYNFFLFLKKIKYIFAKRVLGLPKWTHFFGGPNMDTKNLTFLVELGADMDGFTGISVHLKTKYKDSPILGELGSLFTLRKKN